MNPLNPAPHISAAVAETRRRLVWNEALQGLVLSGVAAAAGVIAILLLGTQLLEWGWLVLLAAGGLGFTIYRTRTRTPAPYRAAQILDERLGMADTVSTAYYYADPGHTDLTALRATPAVRELQRRNAEQTAAAADPALAVPITVPRAAYALAGLSLVALALFGVRYGVERSLDARAPLPTLLLDTFSTPGKQEVAALRKEQAAKKRRVLDDPTPIPLQVDDITGEAQGDLDTAPESVLDTVDVPEVDGFDLPENARTQAAGDPGDSRQEGAGDPLDNDPSGSPDGQSSEGGQARDGDGEGSQSGRPPQAPEVLGDNPTLAAKLRDAMANLMSRMKPQTGSRSSQQEGDQQGSSDGAQMQGGSADGATGAGQEGEGQQSAQSDGGQAGGEGEGKPSDGSGKGQSASQSNQQAGSGMGDQEGDKEVRMAEQLEAMGKLSEVFGKRSQNVTGEVTIEVQTSRQQTRTPLSRVPSAHGQAGGEVHRDEVPEADRDFVRQYFERIRAGESAKPAPEAQP
ncbi:MAG: hypothetical protein IPM24_21020 [Bryobacterales bacterium]|nr:hypothetical protein [Bryobacterales bacterium]